MFTGIIEAVGVVRSITACKGDMRLDINSGQLDFSDVQLGDSIATHGVCLTVVELSTEGYTADVSLETLEHSTLGQLKKGSLVNLERALMPTTRLGGHLVSGHVDGIGEILSVESSARSTQYWLEVSLPLARYIARKGSIAVDGVSLTVNNVENARFSVNIVPHTQKLTTISYWAVGDAVNIEVDQVARYLERLHDPDLCAAEAPKSVISNSFLAKHGFIR